MDVHLFGTFRIFHAAYPHMREQGYGRLVATTSAAGLFGNFGQTNYGAAKLAIVGLCNSLAIEGAKADVKVNTIAPQALSRMTESMMPPDFGKLLSPTRVAPLVAYLASRACTVTGGVFSVGGGRVARVRTGVADGLFNPDLGVREVEEAMPDLLEEEIGNYPTNIMEEVALLLNATGQSG
jgi:NAD(P)-dependent dehydrogenase (short-subunit alcohol dehydrogenase family)